MCAVFDLNMYAVSGTGPQQSRHGAWSAWNRGAGESPTGDVVPWCRSIPRGCPRWPELSSLSCKATVRIATHLRKTPTFHFVIFSRMLPRRVHSAPWGCTSTRSLLLLATILVGSRERGVPLARAGVSSFFGSHKQYVLEPPALQTCGRADWLQGATRFTDENGAWAISIVGRRSACPTRASDHD